MFCLENTRRRASPWVWLWVTLVVAGCATTSPETPPRIVPPVTPETPVVSVAPVVPKRPPVIGLALGGGAARGFAHVGVIQVLEEAGIHPKLVAGTSAGSLVATLCWLVCPAWASPDWSRPWPPCLGWPASGCSSPRI